MLLLFGSAQASQEGDAAQRDYTADRGSLLNTGKPVIPDRGIVEQETC
jgi:hypothetical protein